MQDLSVSTCKLPAGVTCSLFFYAKCHPEIESCHLISNIYINTSLLLPAKKTGEGLFFFFHFAEEVYLVDLIPGDVLHLAASNG